MEDIARQPRRSTGWTTDAPKRNDKAGAAEGPDGHAGVIERGYKPVPDSTTAPITNVSANKLNSVPLADTKRDRRGYVEVSGEAR